MKKLYCLFILVLVFSIMVQSACALEATCSTENGDQTVTVLKVGSLECSVQAEGEETIVGTDSLYWSDELADDERLAVIYAVKRGKVTLRPEPKEKGQVAVCKSGRIVPVLALEDGWAKIWYEGHEGYVPEKYLRFVEAGEDYEEATVNRKQASVYVMKHNESPVVTRLTKDQTVTVFTYGTTWAEVEVDGCRGYVLLTLLDMN